MDLEKRLFERERLPEQVEEGVSVPEPESLTTVEPKRLVIKINPPDDIESSLPPILKG